MKTTTRKAASPRARRAMRQRGIDPAGVCGTGPNGRIVEADVPRLAAAPGPSAKRAAPAGTLSPMRRAVAAKVAESFATVPHFYLRSEVDVTPLVQLRQQTLESIEQCCGHRPSLTDFILRALVLALRDCPHANRIWQNETIVQLPSVDVGLVVQLDDGLMVPILHQADRLGMIELVRQRAAAVAGVRSGRTSADLFQGGATSLTNLGKHRVDEFSPVISPPQSSMLAVGRVAQRPTAFEGRLCLRHTMHLTLSVDHRVMDGVPAAAFLDR
ncbi:MAG: 2-oxo acid dehydrogenase subunit E2, partial [Planctomycetaceae bacterium]|nr:2-oxo acid dehydrogenase subunit E2 [Planctomycetaceae bacterium]